MHTFLNEISAIWNANSLVQDLNTVRRIHFLRRQPLHYEHIVRNV